jgi:hypothetical protein
MIQRAAFLLLLPALAFSAILPDTIGEWKRGDVTAAPAPDAKVWHEYGLEESENAPYTAASKKFSITAYRFSDSTGAFAAWIGSRPPDAKKIETDGLGVETATDRYVAVGNLLLIFHGYKPAKEELAHIFLTAPHYSHSPLPTLPGYLPPGAVPNSERYILGPESLARYAGVIPPSTAAFHFSSEGESADYAAPPGAKGAAKDAKTTIVVFNFPGLEMARKQYPAFASIPGTVAKRSGPLVAIALHPVNPDEAERLLAKVRYQAEVTIAEPPPSLKNNAGNLLLNIAILCGVLMAVCLAGGLFFGGMRYMFRRADSAGSGEEMISLHLTGRH